ncbi:MAG: carbon-nitrogen hydrolase family protein [Gammaproteobacteria bacterium]|nr:carbon-nitrogen hydrolase family protein [Gammaproteobacteria bacterium]
MKIAAIQMCSSQFVDENLKTAERLIAEAAQNQAKLLVLPEMFSIMGEKETDKVKVREEVGKGNIQSFLSEQARKHHIWIVGGTIPISCDNSTKIRAACLVYDDQGKQVARYDKSHLFDVSLSDAEVYKESDTTEPGSECVVVDTPVGRVGLAVCYDLRFPGLFLELAARGAEIIVVPSAFTKKTGEAHWELLMRARAIDTFCYLVGSAQGGVHPNGRHTFGNSMIVDPWGLISAKKEGVAPGVIYATINLDYLREIRRSIGFV